MKFGEFNRLANGMGHVKHLTGKRRRAYAAMRKDENGKWVLVHPDAYFETPEEAYLALKEHKDIIKGRQTKELFKGCFEAYMTEAYPNGGEATKKLKQSYKYSAPLYEKRMADITIWELEEVLKNPAIPRTLFKRIKQLWKGMWSYAIRHDMCKTSPVDNVLWKNKIDMHTEKKRKMMSLAEMTKYLGEAKPSELVEALLLTLYTGIRPGELCNLKTKDVDLELRRIWVNGTKNEAAKRYVPIHKAILDRVRFQKEMAEYAHRDKLFSFGTEKTLNVHYTKELPEMHEAHDWYDLRHQWFTQCELCRIDAYVKDYVGAHAQKGMTHSVYTHLDTPEGWQFALEEFDKFGYSAADKNL